MPDSLPKVQRLSLENFTAFEKATFDFCPGINVLIGANATGKSHVMKVIYTLLKIPEIVYQRETTSQYKVETIHSKLRGIFQSTVNEVIRYGKLEAFVGLDYGDMNVGLTIEREYNFGLEGQALPEYTPIGSIPNPFSLLYLPAQEFLSINEGFIAAYSKRELPYDETYYDLSIALNALPLRKDKLAEVQDGIMFLRKIIAGEQAEENEVVTQENGRFKFSLPEGELDVHLVAEGYRKIATLYYLLRNGSLTKDSILFWDEPEANLNPKLVVEVARVLQMLAKVGMQIFITTHDYLLSHELSLLAEYPSEAGVDIRFFALHKPDRKAGVLVETGETLAEIEHNPILEEFAAHYDRESALFQQTESVQ
ncbi:MAG: AAA family ATPase [Anaerolineae bacterium]